jgi:hypothetical protein
LYYVFARLRVAAGSFLLAAEVDIVGPHTDPRSKEVTRMGGWLGVLVCATPIYLLWGRGQPALLTLAIVNTLLNFWSFGVMHNYAVESSRQRIVQLRDNLVAEGRSQDEVHAVVDRIPLRSNPRLVPNWLARVNLASTIAGLALAVTAFVIR